MHLHTCVHPFMPGRGQPEPDARAPAKGRFCPSDWVSKEAGGQRRPLAYECNAPKYCVLGARSVVM